MQALNRNAPALEDSIAELESIYHSLPVGLCFLDTKLRFVRLNQRFADINGRSIEDHLGRTPREVVPDLGEQAEAALRRILATGEALLDFEVCGETPAHPGMKRYWVEQWIPLKNAHGKIIGISVVAEDITERKLAVEALRQSKQQLEELVQARTNELEQATTRLHQTLESIRDAFYSLDPDLRFLYVNRPALKMTGFSQEELLGRKIEDVFPAIEPITLSTFQKVLREQTARSIEVYSQSLNRWIEVKVYPAPYGLSVYFSDISQRKLEEEKLRQSEERFYKLFHQNPDIVDIIRMRDDQYVDINSMFTQILGYTLEEVQGRTPKEMDIVAAGEFNARKSKLENQSQINNFEVTLKAKSGQKVDLLGSTTLITLDGEMCRLTVFKDITKEKESEAQLTRLDRLNLIGEMAASIAHEVRNPMTTVKGFLQLFKSRKKYGEDGEYFDLMIEEIDRANMIITEFLSLTADRALYLRPGDLNSKLRVLRPLLQADALEHNLTLKLELKDIPQIILDEAEIRQLVLNLVRNGVEATPAGGELSISTSMHNDEITLAIQDQGPGIPSEVLGKLGTPFFTTKPDGNGLGLAVCYRIAQRHSARIEVETSPAGTIFKVIFPQGAAQELIV